MARIEKLLDGQSVNQALQPYLLHSSSSSSSSSSARLKASIKQHKRFCEIVTRSKLSEYRQPFAWAFRPCFTSGENTLDENAHFQVFEQDVQQMSDEHMLKYLAEARSKERPLLSKLTSLTQRGVASLHVELSSFSYSNSLSVVDSSSLGNLQEVRMGRDVVLSMDSFASHQQDLQIVNTEYRNWLYVYPKSLRYEAQKSFAKARNILVKCELRDSDDHMGHIELCPLKVRIYRGYTDERK